ncbi:MAG: sugar ABC transporter permease [Chloroflexota bacterium]|nr:sugar ABC transporter permease [Chloroflexota bacterium]
MASSVTAEALSSEKRGMSARERRHTIYGYVFLSPWIVGFLAFTAVPIVASIVLSFTRYSVLRAPEFIGLRNWRHALLGGDYLMWPSIGRSFYYALISVPTGLVLSLLLAVLLNQNLRVTAMWRTFFFLPSLTPSVATAFVWRWLMNSEMGIFRMVFDAVGLPMPNWLGSTEWALPSLAIISLWGSVGGSGMIIFLAGLQDIPAELLEAAEIDGAGRWRKFRSITLPLLSPVIFFNLVMGIIGALRVFGLAFVATGGGPAHATYFISLHIYNTAFIYFDMGYAAAVSWILAAIVIALTILQFSLSERWVFYQGEVRG